MRRTQTGVDQSSGGMIRNPKFGSAKDTRYQIKIKDRVYGRSLTFEGDGLIMNRRVSD